MIKNFARSIIHSTMKQVQTTHAFSKQNSSKPLFKFTLSQEELQKKLTPI